MRSASAAQQQRSADDYDACIESDAKGEPMRMRAQNFEAQYLHNKRRREMMNVIYELHWVVAWVVVARGCRSIKRFVIWRVGEE